MNAHPIWDNESVTLPASNPVPEEITRVHGCTCGGSLDMHATACGIWQLDHDQRMARVQEARQRLDGYTAALNERRPVLPEEMRRLNEDAATRNAADREQAKAIGSLLIGGAMLFGKRIEIAWPDGLPNGITEDQLKEIGQNMLDTA